MTFRAKGERKKEEDLLEERIIKLLKKRLVKGKLE